MNTTFQYKNCHAAFTAYQYPIVDSIVKAAAPEAIYLLGLKTQNTEATSIFNGTSDCSTSVSGIWLLVLLNNFADKSRQEWQDKIEAHSNIILPTTAIVLETNTFKEWIANGDPFAAYVLQQAGCIYSVIDFSCMETIIATPVDVKELESTLDTSINKAQEFLAGAELYRIRKQYNLSAFMLHQSVEQSLLVLLFIATGLRINTHNVERLLRYGSFLSGAFNDIFQIHREEDKRLIKLLQKAYIDTRYSREYTIHYNDLSQLAEKVRCVTDLTSETCRQMMRTITTTRHHEKQQS